MHVMHAQLLRNAGISKFKLGELEALRCVRGQTAQMRSSTRQTYLDAATADRSGGAKTTGVRWWLKFCLHGRSVSPVTHLHANSEFADKLEAEQLLMDFVLWLVACRPSGKPVSVKSIAKYVGQVRAWHLRTQCTHLCGDLDYSRVRDVLRGVERLVAQPQRLRRFGVRTQDLSLAIATHIDTSTREGSMWAAAMATAFCGLLRGCELGMQDGETFDPTRHLTRADCTFRESHDGTLYMVLIMRPAKKGPGQQKTAPLLIAAGGTLLDPVRLMQRYFALLPVSADGAAITPLFCKGGRAISVREIRGMVQELMRRLGLEPRRFGAHSLRIGGATAALAAGMNPATIRAAGRWSSEVYRIYCRLSRQSAAGVATTIGSTPFEDLERGVKFVDEELMLTADEVPSGLVSSYIERDLLEDAWECEDEM
jgi:hypothetical protein